MNDFKKLLVDNWIFKIALGIIAISSILGILSNSSLFTPFLFPYVPMSLLYCNMYTKNALRTGKDYVTVIHTILYVLSYPGLLLYKLVVMTLKLILSVAKITTPKFGSKGGKKWF